MTMRGRHLERLGWVTAALLAGCGGSGVTSTTGTGGGGTVTGGAGSLPTGGVGAVANPTGGVGATPATGGVDPTGGVGASGATETGGVEDPGGGYIISGPWAGYAWTGAEGDGSSITPEDFADAEGFPLCASGTVGAMDDYSGVGMVGLNINQPPGEDMPEDTWTPGSEEGVVVNISNPGDSPVRIQIQGPNGASDPDDRWCASVGKFDQDVEIPWGSFNTECWNNEGDYYDHQALTGVMALIPGDDTTDTPFDLCIKNIGVYGEGGGGTGGTGGLVGQGVLTEQYASSHVQRDGRDYIIQNNVWGDPNGEQTIDYLGTTFEISSISGQGNANGAPMSYPSVFIGSNNDRSTEGSNLPIQVSAIQSVETSWSWSDAGVSGAYNAAYDVWFSPSSGGENDGIMLMVWLWDPSEAQPAGTEVGNVNIANANFTIWQNQAVISYVRDKTNSMTFDLNDFIQDAVGRGAIQPSWYLTNVFAGFEIWSGGQGLATTDFYVIVQ